jgi:aryl-alcohol dehydrogenase-like predicted oxidoreductase
MKALASADVSHRQRFVAQQIHYTLHSREAEFELLPLGFDQGVSTIVWSPLAGGWLSGKYTRTSRPACGRQVAGFREPPIYNWARLWDIVDVVNEVAAEQGVSGAQVSLAWLLQRPTVASVIVGGRTAEQFEDTMKAATLTLTPDQVVRLDAVSQPPLPYPYWHQSFTAGDRLDEADLILHAPYLGKPLGVEDDPA